MTTQLTAVNADFDRLFPGITPPQPLDEATEEAVEGLFGEGERDE